MVLRNGVLRVGTGRRPDDASHDYDCQLGPTGAQLLDAVHPHHH